MAQTAPASRPRRRSTQASATAADGPLPTLRILETRILRGPNYWAREPVIRMLVDLGVLEEFPSNKIPNFTVAGILKNTHLPVNFWRSVGGSQNCFFFESFIDELAYAAGKDPIEFRRAMLDRKDFLTVLNKLDTIGPRKVLNEIDAKGGSIDSHSISAGAGMLFINSGYGAFGQTPGNVLIAYKPKK